MFCVHWVRLNFEHFALFILPNIPFSIIEVPDEDEEIITEVPETEVNVIPEETEMIKPSKNLSNYNVIDSLPTEEQQVILPPRSEQETLKGRDSDREQIFRVFPFPRAKAILAKFGKVRLTEV